MKWNESRQASKLNSEFHDKPKISMNISLSNVKGNHHGPIRKKFGIHCFTKIKSYMDKKKAVTGNKLFLLNKKSMQITQLKIKKIKDPLKMFKNI